MSNELKRSIAQVLSKYIGPHGGFMTCTTMDRCAEEVFEVVKNHHNHPAPVTCGNGCDCLAQCGDTYAHAGLPKPPDTEKASPAPAVPESAKFIANAQALLDLDAEGALTPHGIGGHARNLLQTAIKLLAATPAPALAVPQGWRFKRNADDSIGIFAPPPKPGESQRTSHAVYPGQNRDLHELLGKLADQQAATPAPAPAQEPETALQKFTRFKVAETEGNPVEMLRAFCAFAMNSQDWFDVEPFFDLVREAMASRTAVAPAQEVGLTDEQKQAVQVMQWLDSGEWELVRSQPLSFLTDEANAESAWLVRRQAAPYCDKSGTRQWAAKTAFGAFTQAIAALRAKGGKP